MIIRDETSGKDLRLAQVEAREALRRYESIAEDGRGRIIFISGEDGIGKSDILQTLADTLSKAQPQPLIIAGRFRDGNYYAWDIGREKPFPTDEALAASGASLASAAQVSGSTFSSTVAPLIPPNIKFAAELIAQLLQAIGATRQFLGKYKGQPQGSFSRDDFKDLLREAEASRPLIYLFDDFHQASLEWNYLFLDIAREIAGKKSVFIFLTLNGPAQPGEHQEHESDLLWLVRELTSKNLADWWSVSPLSRMDVAAWLEPCAPGMGDHLRGVTGGNPRLLIKLFKDWQRRNIIHLRDDQWAWSANGAPAINLFKDVLEKRLKRLLKSAGWQESQGLKQYNDAAELLTCAALEGAVFTAEAVARVLNRDADEVIDFLDDVLAQSDKRPLGIITEVESITIEDEAKGKRALWRYAFVSSLYVAAAREFRNKEERAVLALALAQSLIASYSPEEKQIASKLAWLFKTGGVKEQTVHFQRMADYALMREGLHQHALYMLSINKDDWDEWYCRQAAALFLEAGEKMTNAYPHDETLIVFEEADTMARRGGLLYEQARAIYFCGWLNLILGNSEIAREKTQIVLQQFQKLNNRSGQAASLCQLGSIDVVLGNYESAREYTQRSLAIAEEIGSRQGQAVSLHQLGSIDGDLGNYESAREYTLRALAIREEIGDHQGQAVSLHQLGSIDFELSNYESAREYTQRSLAIAEEIGSRQGQAAGLYQLGSIDYQLSNYESAREYVQHALIIAEEIGDHRIQAKTSRLLERIEKPATGNEADVEPDKVDNPPEDDFQRGGPFE